MVFKASPDVSNNLSDWNSTSIDPCSFSGVSCINQSLQTRPREPRSPRLVRVTHCIGSAPSLERLSLKRNRLSYNVFSSEFPASVTSLARL
ncbi:hypothetical protein F8388_019151 [Cannabis sativa]|uniref:Leucine-rich repeat-containing N-terminal plant-type domain-containing protein n=1 Tax=Cannabis sativa TaxID=3483 RepID=A0A7J6EBP6_CANSA|nr:hypothetical protein F8388_019151 [Cannabis sativa]KAF4402638.1 hypothetical protein G4B88_012423 [Cannabis sativa]